ncbi:MAG: response regulator [Acidobacteriota bacterium]|jgi:CheY-like chemotaxis protein/HPt (histidine-containing phosphotransfer) domain-containing protein|nr:response regulator [Acidobacteriota bacterium]
MKILLTEDSGLNQKLVSRMLQKMGHVCDVAGDGQAALNALQAGCYDAVLMDGQMPVMDGYAATRKIREQERASGRAHIPVIALTGGGSQEDIDECLAAGMDDHLAKPISFKLLEEKLQKYGGHTPASQTGVGRAGGDGVTSAIHTAQIGGNVNMHDEIIKDIVAGLNIPAAIAQKLLNEYLKTLPNDVTQLKAAIDGGDFPAAAKMAHSIKGASGNLRINKIFQLTSELEQLLKGGGAPKEKVDAQVDELQNIVKQLVIPPPPHI